MKPIIFARVADMKWYQGANDNDEPKNGGRYVKETGYGHEDRNFLPVYLEDDPEPYCFGFVMTQNYHQIHLENIIGCELLKKEESVDGVTVVFCSTREAEKGSKYMRVVGFYKNATVFRNRCSCNFEDGYCQEFSFIAKTKDCVLIPYTERYKHSEWFVPSANDPQYGFGFGRSNIWYANKYMDNPALREYLEKMIDATDNYSGRNDIWEEE